MRNLRQRFGGFIVAGILAAILGTTTTPALAETGQIGGAAKNTCAFIAGMLFKVPADSGAATVFQALYLAFDCE
jgi:putative flippase GtrA